MLVHGLPMQDRFTSEDKRLARGILQAVVRYRRKMSAHAVYRSLMHDMRTCVESCDVLRDSLRIETGVAVVQRMIFAALAIVEQEHCPR
jgi:hypothetical protein